MNRSVVWLLIAIAVVVLVPWLGMAGIMGVGIGGMMGGGMACCSGMSGWGIAWILLVATLIVALIIALVRSIIRV